MNGGRTVTKDTCLYAEDYAFTLARERTNGTQQTAIVVCSPGMWLPSSPHMSGTYADAVMWRVQLCIRPAQPQVALSRAQRGRSHAQ